MIDTIPYTPMGSLITEHYNNIAFGYILYYEKSNYIIKFTTIKQRLSKSAVFLCIKHIDENVDIPCIGGNCLRRLSTI